MSQRRNDVLEVKKFVVGPLLTNCYVIYDGQDLQAALIDPGIYADEIAAYIKDKRLRVLYTINTHGHADHIMGDAAFGFPVLIHELDEPCLRDAERSLASFAGITVPAVRASRLLKDGDSIAVGSWEIKVIYTPGHSPGGISLICGGMLFSGDTLFHESVGRTDLCGGDHDLLIEAIKKKLMTLPDEIKVFPGHGPETTIGHERKFNPFL